VPKIFVNGQFYFNLSSETWSHVFLKHSVHLYSPHKDSTCGLTPESHKTLY